MIVPAGKTVGGGRISDRIDAIERTATPRGDPMRERIGALRIDLRAFSAPLL